MRPLGYTPLQVDQTAGFLNFYQKFLLAFHYEPTIRPLVTGYTLIETIVVIAMMAIIGTIAMASYQGSRERNRVYAAALEVAATIREAQQHALAGTVEDAFGYGVRFYNSDRDPSQLSYYLYADRPPVENGLYDPSTDQLLINPATIHDARIKFITYCKDQFDLAVETDNFDIVFNPPHPKSKAIYNEAPANVCIKTCVFVEKDNHRWRIDTDTRSGVTNITENLSTCD